MIRVAVSACLLGQPVRYDGQDKRHAVVVSLATQFELVPVCPEVELGLGVPRPPIERTVDGGLQVVASGEDLTASMIAFAARRARQLGDIAGYVLKHKSPSCGLSGVRLAGGAGTGVGLFAEQIAALLPNLPVTEDIDLEQPGAVAEFVAAVRRFAASRP